MSPNAESPTPAPSPPAAKAPPDGMLDVVVIGTGFGGAVTACRLAQAGISVLVLERGRRYESKDFPNLPTDSTLVPDLRRWTWQQSQGLWDILDLEELISVQAAGYGGGSLIYANVHLRPPPAVFDDRWPAAYRRPATLERFFDLAGYMLDVAPITAHPTIFPNLTKADQLQNATTQLGRGPGHGFFYPPLAVNRTPGPNRHGREQNPCTGCGACCTGCPEKAKNTLDFNYLALAEHHGATVTCQIEVRRIVQIPGGWALECLDHLQARRRRIETRNVFLCAGSVHSTRLLQSARLRTPRARRSRSLAGAAYFPGGDALGVVYDTQHPQHPSYGPAITTTTAACDPDRAGSFFMIQDGGYAAELARLVGTLRAPGWVGRNRITRRSPASVPRSWMTPPPPAPKPTNSLTLVSPLDDLMAALKDGAFHDIASPTLRAEWYSFLSELKRPLLLSPVVERTIEMSVDDSLGRSWLLRRLNPDGPLAGLVKAFQRWIIRTVYGSTHAFANRALRAILTQGNLSAPEVGREMLGYSAENAVQRTMLLAMGRDAAPASLTYDRRRDRMIADLDLFHLVPGYTSQESLMADVARALGGELRINPAWSFLGKPITVHNQGGCGMSDAQVPGVTTPSGAVRGARGLYVSDGAVLCTSVGVNPSATIMAIAERNVLRFIRRFKGAPRWPAGDLGPGAVEYAQQQAEARAWAARARQDGVVLTPPQPANLGFDAAPLGVAFDETMQGYFSPTLVGPHFDEGYRVLETRGRIDYPMRVDLTLTAENLNLFRTDIYHRMTIAGTIRTALPGVQEQTYETTGEIDLLADRFKPYAMTDPERIKSHERLTGHKYRSQRGEPPAGAQRFMKYKLTFRDGAQHLWRVNGYKRIRDDPGPDAWRDASSLFVTLSGPDPDPAAPRNDNLFVRGAGVIHVDLESFMLKQIPSMRALGAHGDRTRALWAKVQFATFFFGTLQRIYLPEVQAALKAFFKVDAENLVHEPHRVPR